MHLIDSCYSFCHHFGDLQRKYFYNPLLFDEKKNGFNGVLLLNKQCWQTNAMKELHNRKIKYHKKDYHSLFTLIQLNSSYLE